jgi:hypothetical protein
MNNNQFSNYHPSNVLWNLSTRENDIDWSVLPTIIIIMDLDTKQIIQTDINNLKKINNFSLCAIMAVFHKE